MKNKIMMIVIFVMMLIPPVVMFNVGIHKVYENKNVEFNSQYIFTKEGFADIKKNIKLKQKDYETYISGNQERIDGYNLGEYEKSITEVENGNYNLFTAHINEVLKAIDDKELYIRDLKVLVDKEVLDTNIELIKTGQDSSTRGIRTELNEKLFTLEKLQIILNIIKENINSAEAIEYENDTLKIANKEYKIEIYDSAADQVYHMDNMNSKRRRTAEKIVEIRNIVSVVTIILMIVVIILVVIYKNVSVLELLGIGGMFVLYVIIIIVLSNVYIEISKGYSPVYEKINTNFGVDINSQDRYELNYKPILIMQEFVLRAGGEEGLPKGGDLKDNESFDNWLEEEHEFYVLDEEGNATENTYIQSNYETLKNIRDEIEYDIPRPSSDSKHPGFGGYGQ